MNAITSLLHKIPGKTIIGSVLIGASFVPHPSVVPFSGYLLSIGTAIGGVGLAHKLEKIKDALTGAGQP